jgi:hypothetical protein
LVSNLKGLDASLESLAVQPADRDWYLAEARRAFDRAIRDRKERGDA